MPSTEMVMVGETGVRLEALDMGNGWSAEIYRDWAFPEDVLQWWQTAAERQGDVGVFVSPGWLEQWWSGWGNNGNLFTVILRRGEVIRAVFPYYIRPSDNGDHAIRSLDVEVHHDIMADDDGLDVFGRLLATHFRRLPVQSEYLSGQGAARVLGICRKRRFPAWAYAEPFAPYLELKPNWDDLVSSVGSHFIHKLDKKLRHAQREYEVTLDIHRSVDGLQSLLTAAFELEARGWKGRNGTAINQVPRQERFLRHACEWAARNGRLWLVVLRFGGRMVAFDIGIESAGTVFVLKTSFDEELSGKYSSGHLVHLKLLRHGVETRAFQRLNFLGKNDSWKQEWTRNVGECQCVFVYPRTLSGHWDYLRHYAWKKPLQRSQTLLRLAGPLRRLWGGSQS